MNVAQDNLGKPKIVRCVYRTWGVTDWARLVAMRSRNPHGHLAGTGVTNVSCHTQFLMCLGTKLRLAGYGQS